MQRQATTVTAYLASLPPDRRAAPEGYHCDPRQPVPCAARASQKHYMSLDLTTPQDNSMTMTSRLVLGALAIAALSAVSAAQAPATANGWDPQQILRDERFVKPPALVERIIMAPRTDISFESPNADRSWFIRTTGPDRGTIQSWGQPHLFLGGLQLDPRANRARSLTTGTRTGITLVNPRAGVSRAMQVPAGATVSGETWSPNGAQIVFIANFPDASHVYLADVSTGRSTQMSRTPLLATFVTGLSFSADGRQLLVVQLPDGRGAAPTHGPGGIEDGPQVRLTGARAVPQPVHASLLEDPHDKALLVYHTTGQLALIDIARRTTRKIGAPTMIRSVDLAPDARYFRVTRMTEPFSYLVPVNAFGSVQELWDANGAVIATLSRTGLREERGGGFGPGGAVGGANAAPDTGKRNIQWNPIGPGLVYLQSIMAAPFTDSTARPSRVAAARPTVSSVRFMNWLPPFGPNDTKVLYEGGPQLTNVMWSADGQTMFVNDSGAVAAVRVANPGRKYALGRGVTLPGGGFGGGFGGGGFGGFGGGNAPSDTLGVGGAIVTMRGPSGHLLVMLGGDQKSVHVSGTRQYGAAWSSRAPRPWTDRLDIETGSRTRVFDAPADAFERVVTPLDDDFSQYVFTRQTATTIEDAYFRDARAGTTRRLTNAVDVAPEVTGALRKRIRVTRPRDGFRLWVDVTFPREWKAGSDTPGIIWFYPREYATEQAYERSRWSNNINQFPAVPAARPATATELWVAGGYTFVEPDIPIFGDSGRLNDNYTRDLKENLDAVLDAMVDSGFVKRGRMGIGGHSYGAFSTVNAMTLVPYFKAGIAGDGMYNRSLTPFGFQSERRNFFEAQATYLDMSPFYRADKLSGALLLYHGLEDQNSGTAPMSSTRMMDVLQGLGKEAALYMYPYEDHSVATYESDLDLWARWLAWFDVHLKNAKQEKPTFTP